MKLWSSGSYNKEAAAVRFSADNFADRLKVFTDLVGGLNENHWLLILKEASEIACTLARSSANGDDDSDASNIEEPSGEVYNPATLADEDEDSDLEALINNA